MLRMHELIRRGAEQGQPVIQPSPGGGRVRILIAQPQHELDDEGGRETLGRVAADQRVRLQAISVHAQQPIGHGVRILARRPAADYARGRAAQILDQHDAKGDGNRPQLADGERLHALISPDEQAQRLQVEVAVAVRDHSPRHAEYPREARERTVREPR